MKFKKSHYKSFQVNVEISVREIDFKIDRCICRHSFKYLDFSGANRTKSQSRAQLYRGNSYRCLYYCFRDYCN